MSIINPLSRLTRNWLTAFLEPRRILGLLTLPHYFYDWWRYNQLSEATIISWKESYPCLADKTVHTPFDPQYFHQSAWAARKLARQSISFHVDIGSSIMFLNTISAWIPIVFIDYRPLIVEVKQFSAVGGDILALPFADDTLYSLSCLHVIEHIGLGRYGDPLNPHGSINAAKELTRVLTRGGRLLLSTPVGRERVQFNAHRIFSPLTIVSIFDQLKLKSFSFVDDSGNFHNEVSPKHAVNCEYACGMFEFVKV